MTLRDLAAATCVYGGALTLLTGLIGGWTWPLTIGGLALITGLLTLNEGENQ